ncbi:hypothetical protein MHLP_00180 [Candidatus Mycoplasma haematolamae str. Purdue]|uniref:Uncharacterized protein n=1 Tax=Mycoplasma haematolamae (strain Purdue) TaxID=1212765 RepID=I7CEF6_MYCHA|nr:hypothetical protein [Candidatus Mycoplasma haematolamae]AFO51616.1 hypothetical protein MHLP_00180 [Candidatus Mycoplasma haematolamae str. Purdue]
MLGRLRRYRREEEEIEIGLELEGFVTPKEKTNIFEKGINVQFIRDYYRRLEKSVNFWFYFSYCFFFVALYFVMVESVALWCGTSVPHKLLAKLKGTLWYQIPISVVFGFVLLACFVSTIRLKKRREQVTNEHALCRQKYFPTVVTPTISNKIYALLSARNNCSWTGFVIGGFGFIFFVYGHLGQVGYQLVKGWQSYEWFQPSKAFSFQAASFYNPMMSIGALTFITGCALFLICVPPLSYAIKRTLGVWNLDERTMGPELTRRLSRLNKRNKITVTIILCIIGCFIYLVFRKLVLAVFNKSSWYLKE